MDGTGGDDIACPPRRSGLRASSFNKFEARLCPKDALSQHSDESRARGSQSDTDEAAVSHKRNNNKSSIPTCTSSSGVTTSKSPSDLGRKTQRTAKTSRSSKRQSTGDIDAQSAKSIPSIVKTSSSPTTPAMGAGFFNLAHFLSVQTHDATSKTATTRSDTTQVDDLNTELPDSCNTPMTSPLQGSESYYIFAPQSTGSAYYLHHNSDDTLGPDSEFKITKVPMTLVPHETGGLSYMVRMAEEERPSDHQGHPLWSLKAYEGSTASLSIKDSPCYEDSREPPRRDQGGNRGPRTKKAARIESYIMTKVNERLVALRHQGSEIKITDENGKHASDTKNKFLVDDSDIRDIVAIVMDEMQKAKKSARGEGNKVKDNSKLLSGPKLDGSSNIIRLPSVSVADPATTISMPRTSYASVSAEDLQVHTRTRGEDSGTFTTFISKKSVAEITWPPRNPNVHRLEVHPSPGHSRAVSEISTPTQRPPTTRSSSRRQSEPPVVAGDFVFRHYSTSKNGSEVVFDMSQRPNHPPEKQTNDSTDITSFPRLLPRRCTKDWLVPPTEVDVVPPALSNLYRRSVDARRGKALEGPSKFFQGQVRIRHYEHAPFSDNSFSTKSAKADKNVSTESLSTTANNRFGASIGTASHKRRSFQLPGSQESDQESQDSFFPSLMDKIRQGSQKIFYRQHSLKKPDDPPITNHDDGFPWEHGQRSRNSVVRRLTPEPPRPDAAGIYEAMTGTRRASTRCRNTPCSEDYQPHVCELRS